MERHDELGGELKPSFAYTVVYVRDVATSLSFYADVDAAYKRAVENGAIPVHEPEEKVWGQKIGYVRDIDGIVVRMESSLNSSPPQASHQ